MKIRSLGLLLVTILVAFSLAGCGCFIQAQKGTTPPPKPPEQQQVVIEEKKEEAAASLKLTSHDLKRFGIVDDIVTEPIGTCFFQPPDSIIGNHVQRLY